MDVQNPYRLGAQTRGPGPCRTPDPKPTLGARLLHAFEMLWATENGGPSRRPAQGKALWPVFTVKTADSGLYAGIRLQPVNENGNNIRQRLFCAFSFGHIPYYSLVSYYCCAFSFVLLHAGTINT